MPDSPGFENTRCQWSEAPVSEPIVRTAATLGRNSQEPADSGAASEGSLGELEIARWRAPPDQLVGSAGAGIVGSRAPNEY